jgi:hypothetical protein
MTESTVEKKEKVRRDRTRIFQKDENGDLLVPADQLKTKTSEVMELYPTQIKANKPPVSEEVRLKRIEQGKKLGEIRRAKCVVINAEKERVRREKEEADAKAQEEEKERHRKDIEQQILDKKLIRVRIKELPKRVKKVKPVEEETEKEPVKRVRKVKEETETEPPTETEDDTDIEEDRHKQRHIRKQALKTAKAIEKIDTVISAHRNPYMDRLMSLMK